jgi:hypothetical protein
MSKLIVFGLTLVFSLFFIDYLDVWKYRDARALDVDLISEEYIERESRYIELDNTLYILKNNNQLLQGTGYLFDETGRYLHKDPNRSMHGAYSRILFGAGFIGLILYITYLILVLFHIYNNNISKNTFQSAIFSSFVVLMLVLLGAASGQGASSPYVATIFVLSGYFIKHKRYKL